MIRSLPYCLFSPLIAAAGLLAAQAAPDKPNFSYIMSDELAKFGRQDETDTPEKEGKRAKAVTKQ